MPHTTDDFDYDAPAELIAQRPLGDRSASRLLVLDRGTGRITHGRFPDVRDLVHPGDVVVLNTSRVLPARLRGTRPDGGEAEVLLVHPEPDGTWLGMVRPGRALTAGCTVTFGEAAAVTIVALAAGGLRRLRLDGALGWGELMERYGAVPLPPYIRRAPDAEDRERYQTVYARVGGSVAAPTAGLHFTPATLSDLARRGARVAEVVLHVGPGTFRPVKVRDPAAHDMHEEWYLVPEVTAHTVNEARRAGGRIWAIGTTVARVLETAGAGGELHSGSGWTRLFIRPPYAFRMVDAMVTNFHLPRSTLLMLVCAFGGHPEVLAAYRAAVAAGYRLYSYGDAMAIV